VRDSSFDHHSDRSSDWFRYTRTAE